MTEWAYRICWLQSQGYSKARISKELNVPWSTVDGWCRGHEPLYSAGAALIDLCEKISQITKLRDTTEERPAINA